MLLEKITRVWILIAALCRIDSGQASAFHQSPPVVSVETSEAVSLHCTFEEQKRNEQMVWYRQKQGQAPQMVGVIFSSEPIIQPEFKKSRIKLEKTSNSISLIIPNTTKDDEGTYYCGISHSYIIEFSTGTFLAVSDHSQPNISVLQSPALQSVPPGQWVNLQCRVLSEIRSAELRVLWFRSSAGSSFPQIIYIHPNSSVRQCEVSSSNLSCVYNFSTNIHHAATYYCAVDTCGRVIIGNGTTVNLVRPLDPVVICLGAAVGVCIVVIAVQAALIRKKKTLSEQCRAKKLQQGSSKQKAPNQDHDAEELNYAALNFQERKTKKTRVKKEKDEGMVYSTVRCSSINDHRPDH